MRIARASGLVAGGVVVATALAVAPGCIFAFTQNSLGNGSGCVTGALNIPACWSGQFNLQPDFFVGVPYNGTTFDIRVQRGSDFETFSDGIAVLVDDVNAIRPDPDAGADGGAGLLGVALSVSLPPGVTPPGVPLVANPNPSSVHVSLYMQKTCQTQDVGLYAMDVSLSPDGTCAGVAPLFLCSVPTPASDGQAGVPDATADGAVGMEGGAPDAGGAPTAPQVGHSTMTFTSLFDDNPDESNATQRLTSATFDLYFADPRDVAPGGVGPPPPCQGHLQGSFKFYFQRGQPGQPFP